MATALVFRISYGHSVSWYRRDHAVFRPNGAMPDLAPLLCMRLPVCCLGKIMATEPHRKRSKEGHMYARVTFAQVRPGELQKTLGLLRDTLYPAFERMEGFEGALLLANPAAEKVCGITMWESEDLMPRVTRTSTEAAGRATRRFFEAPPLERLATIPLAGQPDREVYQVAARLAAAQHRASARARVLTAPGRARRYGPGCRNCPRPGFSQCAAAARVSVLPGAHPTRRRHFSGRDSMG